MTSVLHGRTDRIEDATARRRLRIGVAVWVALVSTAIVVGAPLRDDGINFGAAPLVGRWDIRLGIGLYLAMAVAGLVVAMGPRLADELSWRPLLLVTAMASALWATTLALNDGWDRLTRPLTSRYEYEPHAASVSSATDFVRTFVESVPDLPTHVKSHPPGATLVPWVLDRLGLAGAGWFAALVILSWGIATAAVLVAARSVLGERRAREAAPVLVLLPAAVWAATSADALFTAALAVGVVVALGQTRQRAFVGGLAVGAALLLTYGGALLLAVPAAVAWQRRRPDLLVAVLVGVAVVLVAAGAAGFWWPAGLEAARGEYWDGVASRRPGVYSTVLGNPAALAMAIGPAVAAGLVRRPQLLAGAGLVAVLAADLSQLSRGEVERIWLPFVPWLALAAPPGRRWLLAQAATGITLQAALRSSW